MPHATDIVDALDEAATEGDPIPVDHILDHFDRRSFGAAIMVPALLEMTPVGGIPGVPTVIAVIIALFAIQMALGREDMWLPGILGRRTVHADTLKAASAKLRGVARWADRHFGAHLHVLLMPPAPQITAVAIVALCLIVPPLELIPFASTLPMATIALFGAGLFMRDGRIMALAWLVFLGSIWGLWELAGPRVVGWLS
ncbi:exopolysaccharide biosynthesis protein [Jannaschia sp. LMIT008]|uniref:exopolysaccharide biosynthesis protein n=1 Tax=Jannaschia maritima TaxID=3032585 RepID=UPI0028121CD0|nr:exopolysaccharide biosynthesis protein [Jannaschia sp. LMIT008]